jgi:hypothetical protein
MKTDALNRLKSRFKTGIKNKIISFVCAALCLVCAAGAALAARAAHEEIPYYADGMQAGTLCKVDIVKIDRAFALTENGGDAYFVCMTAEQRLFVVKMQQKTFETDFADVYAYTLGEAASASPVSFSGRLEDMTDELNEIGAGYWGGDDFTDYVGTLYIDASIAQSDYTLWWIAGASFSLALGIVNFTLFLRRRILSSRCLRRIQNTGKLQSVLDDLDDGNCTAFGKRELIFGPQHLICPPKGIAYAYGDIAWCYGKRTRLYFFAVSKNLTVCDRFGVQTNMLYSKASSARVDEALDCIMRHAPQSLFGFSEENKKLYALRYGKKNKKITE